MPSNSINAAVASVANTWTELYTVPDTGVALAMVSINIANNRSINSLNGISSVQMAVVNSDITTPTALKDIFEPTVQLQYQDTAGYEKLILKPGQKILVKADNSSVGFRLEGVLRSSNDRIPVMTTFKIANEGVWLPVYTIPNNANVSSLDIWLNNRETLNDGVINYSMAVGVDSTPGTADIIEPNMAFNGLTYDKTYYANNNLKGGVSIYIKSDSTNLYGFVTGLYDLVT